MLGRMTSLLTFGLLLSLHDLGARAGYLRASYSSHVSSGLPLAPPRPSQMERLREVYAWSQMDFNFTSEAHRQQAIDSGTFVRSNVSVPGSVEAAGSRVFVTIPRWLHGTPATLSTVPYPSDTRSPLLTPYPSWEFNRQGNCDGLTSVYRVKVDECNRVWVLDTGIINTFERPQNLCPFQIIAFDLSTDQMIHRYRIPPSVLRNDTLLVTIEVEYPLGHCGQPTDAVIYMADSDAFQLIVADMSSGESWNIRDKTMYPSPEAGTFNIAGDTFELMDGIFGLALSYSPPSQRVLYYSAMNSYTQRWVPASIARNQTAVTSNPRVFQSSAQTRTSQAGDSAINRNNVMFFGLLGEQAVACWNTRTPYGPTNFAILAQDDRTLQFPVSVQVDNSDQLWIMSTRFQSFAIGTLSESDVNFRVFMALTADVVRGTICDTQSG